ncbi:B3 domain-containing protein [Cardamine amara subsp. amara]|uniref:B3 domain-containing protein n=1 Tax=Cardamine amara subsp. amara TaxID=228776 RepID=A0ABD1BJZ4_CARAN
MSSCISRTQTPPKQKTKMEQEKNEFVSPYTDFLRIYNSHLHSQRVEISSAHNKYYPKPLPRTAVLRKPEGNFWTVKWEMSEEEITSFQDGWSKFAKDNGLIDGDFVLFTYDGSRGFWVRIYRNGLLVNATDPVIIQEISDDEDETSGDNDDHQDMEEDSSENKIISLSLGSSDDSDYGAAICEVNNACGSSKKVVGSVKKDLAAIADPTAYLNDAKNPFFISTSSGSRRVLVIAMQVIKDYVLQFGRTINLIDEFGVLERKVGVWKDRVVVYQWEEMYKRNNTKPGDVIICEVIRVHDVVRSIKVHFVKK